MLYYNVIMTLVATLIRYHYANIILYSGHIVVPGRLHLLLNYYNMHIEITKINFRYSIRFMHPPVQSLSW